ncbi:hypothetical protein K466DRAFT_668371 [Polyporus arcularius HHB13444]|uniref:Uncharacterized protein n=1 Tax=Polyporus arcularius HHB13444 TaxID=1314778 RepID=A0A5C3NYX8_9APHY|nr:hypothetical protein K466DRAFT_668371 [Polyporus arcularius HHB13444]
MNTHAPLMLAHMRMRRGARRSVTHALRCVALRTFICARVFLTSRPEPHYIHRVFTTADLEPHISVVSIQEFRSSVTGDIERLLRARLAEHETSKRLSEQDPSRVTHIVEKSEALFIYARTAIDFLLADVDDLLSIQERYEVLMRVEEVIGLAPLDTLYRAVLENVFPPKDRFPQMQDRLKRVLGYLVALLDPDGISPSMLEKLTNMPTAESVPILNKLRSVVLFNRDDVDSRFRIIHATFREFLVDHERSGDVFHVRAKQVHQSLANDCMSVMRSVRDRLAALLLRLLTENVPELSYVYYAYKYRSYHVYYAYKYRNHHLTNLTSALCQDPPGNSQITIGDDESLPAQIVSYMDAPDPFSMWGLIRSVVRQLRSSWNAREDLEEMLSSLEKWISGWEASIRMDELTTGDDREQMRRMQITLISVLLDIQAVQNKLFVDSEAHRSETIRSLTHTELTLGDQLRDLGSALRLINVYKNYLDIDYLLGEAFITLREAHKQFHKAIITAGFTPGHQCEDEYAAYQERKRRRDPGSSMLST